MTEGLEKVAPNVRRMEKFTARRLLNELDEAATWSLGLDEATMEDAKAFDQLINFMTRIAERD